MAINNFKDYQEMVARRSAEKSANGGNNFANSDSQSVQFFKIAAGETVLVRFNINSMDEIPFASVHHAKFGKSFNGNKNKFAPVKCLDENCPFCVAAAKDEGHDVVNKKSFAIFVEMLVSRFDKTTNTWSEAVPMVWERTASFGEKYLDPKVKQLQGGKLSDYLCTISRTGATKDDTTYSVDFAMPQIYPDNLITHDMSVFDNLKINKFSYYDKTADEMTTFLTTGSFPEVVKTETSAAAQSTFTAPAQPATNVAPTQTPNAFASAEANPFGTTTYQQSQAPINEAPKTHTWDFNTFR